MSQLKKLYETIKEVGAISAETYVNNVVLIANESQTVTIPAGATVVLLASNNDIWVNFVTTATIPTANIVNGNGSILNPSNPRDIRGITAISVISASDCVVSAAFFKNK